MFKRTVIAHAVALAVALPGIALAEEDDESYDDESYFDQIEYYGYLKNETSVFTRNGTINGAAHNQFNQDPNRRHDWGDTLKFENSARLFLNGPIGEESSWHLDLNAIYDTKGANSYYKGHQSYTQNDWFREGYVDTFVNTPAGPLDLRLGKQQVVWGTADGIKLLDIVNPTDFREFVQNTMEDSRIPVFMAKAELEVGETGNLQILVTQAKENKHPGLSRADTGGVRSTPVSGNNPFAPGYGANNTQLRSADREQPFIAMGTDSITGGVNGFRNITPALGAVSTTFNFAALGGGSPVGLLPFAGVTVNDFVTNPAVSAGFGCGLAPGLSADGGTCLSQYANLTNDFVTNLIDTETGGAWDTNKPNSAFEYMPNATFATFNTFVGAKTNYRRDYPNDLESQNFGSRYKGSLFGGSFNYSVNYLYAWDNNPSIKVRWKNDSGETLQVNRVNAVGVSGPTTTVTLNDSQGNFYGAFDPNTGAPINRPATLEFEERVHRVHNVGGSFDSSFDVGFLLTNPLVVRGELLYQKDVRVPEIDRNALAIGDITNGLLTKKADFFKYVIGLDFLVWTNLTMSAQFIQFYNLDYEGGNSRYTGDPGTLHLSNGLQDGQEYDNFYSFFVSKPFGQSQLGRFNNIILYEQGRGGGWWNRMDVEYEFTDEFVGSVEWNQYWGDEDSLFGQFDKSSNFQVGLKYIFE